MSPFIANRNAAAAMIPARIFAMTASDHPFPHLVFRKVRNAIGRQERVKAFPVAVLPDLCALKFPVPDTRAARFTGDLFPRLLGALTGTMRVSFSFNRITATPAQFRLEDEVMCVSQLDAPKIIPHSAQIEIPTTGLPWLDILFHSWSMHSPPAVNL